MFNLQISKKEDNQRISHTATAIDLYFSLVDDLETICCFLDFHKTKESKKKTQKTVINLLVLGHDA